MSDTTELNTELLDAKKVVKAATAAGDRLRAEFSPGARPASRADLAAVGQTHRGPGAGPAADRS